MKILLLDSNQAYRDYSDILEQSKENNVTHANDGTQALSILRRSMFDLIILDFIPSPISGIEVLRWIRNNLGGRTPVIILLSRDYSLADVLNAGADDCIKMPVSTNEFVARVNAVSRRVIAREDSDGTISIGAYVIPRGGQNIFVDGQAVRVTRMEFDIIAALFRNIGHVVPREHLIASLWGSSVDMSSRSLDTHVYRAKSKLRLNGSQGLLLRSIYNFGYRLERV
ncbi:response regulator transcription factor [Burkholderia sola]|uniref:response regulator transcription factor n=1 Tax=Burkholderia sola TaxID=2843302 RepID=UPI0023DDA540|nr:response regulator transcription factor [Burkholderia sola]MDF3084397.1 response regulator transcription factor [Burkholderia sola]